MVIRGTVVDICRIDASLQAGFSFRRTLRNF